MLVIGQEPRPSTIADSVTGVKPDVKTVSTFRFLNQYGPMLLCGYIGGDDLLVAEVPWLKVLKKLPDPMYRAKFGT